MRALIRLCGAVIFLFLAIEAAMIGTEWQGTGGESSGSMIRVIAALYSGEAPAELRMAGDPSSWRALIAGRAGESGRVLVMAVAIVLSFGYTIGILAGRFRFFAAIPVILRPFFLAMWLPAVWVMSLCTWWLTEKRGQPLTFESFPAMDDLNGVEDWWRALFPAVCVAVSVVGTQVRTIVGAIRKSARPFHIRAAVSQGNSMGRVFYGAVFRGAAVPVIRSFGQVFPLMIGLQIFVEWAFRFPGLGSLAVDSARAGRFEALLAGGLVMAVLSVAVWWLEELSIGLRNRRWQERGGDRG